MLTKYPEKTEPVGLPRETFEEPMFDAPFFRNATEEIDRFFREFGLKTWLRPKLVEKDYAWTPTIEILTKKDRLIVRAEIPGVNPAEVKVELVEGLLTIKGERRKEVIDEKEGFYKSERLYGQFLRTIPLPEGAIDEEAKATFTNGVLEVIVPIPPYAPPKAKTLKIETVVPKL
jgi:HSP20 family protein